MTKLIRDPQLDDLVKELNQRKAEEESVPPSWPPALIPSGNPIEALLIEVARRGASDLLILAGTHPIFRVAGRLAAGDRAPLSSDDVHSLLGIFLTSRVRERIEADGSADFSVRLANTALEDSRRSWRFRVNIHRQRGTLAAAIRALPSTIPTLTDLHLPATLAELVKPTHGLVLICGPTGAGKSTTLAALVGELNRNESRHIITIEDPIEYEHRNNKSVIEQIEIGRDAPSFASALRASLRQDPDVILVGEMRDLETVATALTAAETGHLILSTLHTSDTAQAIHRIIDVFPPAQQTQIKQQLALSLNGIVVQQLVPRSDGQGRCVAVEVLLASQPVRNHIRNEKLQNLISEITLGKRQGMISLEDSLARLVRQGLIGVEDARNRASRPDELESQLRSQG
ncbi:MAG TPA: PilT/PilU family type 4a pilus ATPase [Thermoanaerobaculia bacterium]|nr:PilT/PilU family type 4a pilus ATPase [Thermoanaerobaculia bacterium]